MKLLFKITLVILIFNSCSVSKTSYFFNYQDEYGLVELHSFNKKSKPLVIVIPAVYNSLIIDEQIENLAKKNRVAVVYFISHLDKTRLQQIDGFANRQNYYSSVLSELLEEEKEPPTLIAEGINATLALQLGLNFNQPNLVLINSWCPTIVDFITVNCYANQDNSCDSLINYLSLSDRITTNDLITALNENEGNKQYGNYTLDVWKEFIKLSCNDYLVKYNAKIDWLYTTNTGLLSPEEQLKLSSGHTRRKNTVLLSKKSFYKKSILN